jgi:hypothetical protein
MPGADPHNPDACVVAARFKKGWKWVARLLAAVSRRAVSFRTETKSATTGQICWEARVAHP